MTNAGFRRMTALLGVTAVALGLMAGGTALAQDDPGTSTSPMAKCHVQQLFDGPGCGGAMMGAGPDCSGCPQMMGHNAAMLGALGLSEDQQKRVREIHEGKRGEHIRLQKEMARLQNQLEGELLKDSPAVETLRALAGQIGNIRTQEMVLRLETRLAVRGVLTQEQRDRMLLDRRGPRGGCCEMTGGGGHRCGGHDCGHRPGARMGCDGQRGCPGAAGPRGCLGANAPGGCHGANPPGTCRGVAPDASKEKPKGK